MVKKTNSTPIVIGGGLVVIIIIIVVVVLITQSNDDSPSGPSAGPSGPSAGPSPGPSAGPSPAPAPAPSQPLLPGECRFNSDCVSVAGKPNCYFPPGQKQEGDIGICGVCSGPENCALNGSSTACFNGNCVNPDTIPVQNCSDSDDCFGNGKGWVHCYTPQGANFGTCQECTENGHCGLNFEKTVCGAETIAIPRCFECTTDSDCRDGYCLGGGTSGATCPKTCVDNSECEGSRICQPAGSGGKRFCQDQLIPR